MWTADCGSSGRRAVSAPTNRFWKPAISRSPSDGALDAGSFAGGGGARVDGPALQGEQRQRRRPGNRLQRRLEDAAVAVVDAALVENAVEEQFRALIDARVAAEAGAAEGQARPGGRLGPGERVFRPRP